MGRPIEKRYIGAAGANKIKCRVKIGTGTSGAGNYAEADGGIVRQRGSKRFRVGITYTFTATISSGTLTVTAVGTLPTNFPTAPIAVGTVITGTDTTTSTTFQTTVTALGTGTGGAGTYTVGNSSIALTSSSNNVRALDTTRTAVCTLVDKGDGALGANEMSIAIKNDAGTIVAATKLYSRVVVAGGVKTPWTFTTSTTDGKAEVEEGADAFVIPTTTTTAAPTTSTTTTTAAPSDRRLKRNIVFLETRNDIKLYSFQYLWSDEYFVGVMAQDLLGTRYESAVIETNGYYTVDYSQLGFDMQTLSDYNALTV
jgi:hypothetical protein